MSPPLRTATRRRLPAVWTTTPSPSSGPGWLPSSVSAACSAARWSASSPGQAKKQSSIGGTGLRIRPIWRLRSGHPLFLAAQGGWGGEGGGKLIMALIIMFMFNHFNQDKKFSLKKWLQSVPAPQHAQKSKRKLFKIKKHTFACVIFNRKQ